MKWVKASEGLPEVKDDVVVNSAFLGGYMVDRKTDTLNLKWDGFSRVGSYIEESGNVKKCWAIAEVGIIASHEFDKIEWLDESPSPSIEELAQKLREANPWPKDSNDMYQRHISWKLCVDEMIKLSKEHQTKQNG